jgi:hypothetical protein
MGHETSSAAMRSEAEIRERLEGFSTYLDGVLDRLQAGLPWLDSPYRSASGYQGYDKYTDALLDMIKALEGVIYK